MSSHHNNKEEQNYLDLLKYILEHGSKRQDRTGVGTLGVFGTQLRFSLADNRVPILTTRKMFTKAAICELLFFLKGETNTKKLEAQGVNIWKGNTSREFLDARGLKNLPVGNMGKGYGWQWRSFGAEIVNGERVGGVDQLANALHLIKHDPYSRRILVSAWNPKQMSDTALPPCHYSWQFYVDSGKLSLMWNQRSVDCVLGLPTNMISYAILTRLFAMATGLEPGDLIFSGADTHIYLNHLEQIKTQINRVPLPFPKLYIDKPVNSLEDMENLSFEDFRVEGYLHHEAIRAPMAV